MRFSAWSPLPALIFTTAFSGGSMACSAHTQQSAQHRSIAHDPSSSSASSKTWQNCYAAFAPSGIARDDLARLTRACGALGGMHPLSDVTMGRQNAGDPVDRYAFNVASAGSCYRIYASGAKDVGDLDLLLRDSTGQPLAADVTHDAWPVLPPRAPLCVDRAGVYLLEVSVYRGAGQYALQVWGR
jgi:hypothetical protein